MGGRESPVAQQAYVDLGPMTEEQGLDRERELDSPIPQGAGLSRADIAADEEDDAGAVVGRALGGLAGMSPARRPRAPWAAAWPPSEVQPAYLHSLPPTDGRAALEVTLPRGGRKFILELPHAISDGAPTSSAGSGSALSGSIPGAHVASMRKELDQEATLEAAVSRVAGDGPPLADAPAQRRKKKSPSGQAMWVDTYAPKNFLHLLSPDDVNRNVLRWVKLWDARVFGRPVKHAPAPSSAATDTKGPARSLERALGAGRRQDVSASKKSGEGKAADSAAGGNKRPWESRPGDGAYLGFGYGWRADSRIILLAGAPGTGKTTLAHVIAQAAGYTPCEINASDERSAASVRERVTAAQQMRTLTGGGKPSLVIMDECDGMDSKAVAELVRMVRNTPPILPRPDGQTGGPSEGNATGGKKRCRGGEAAPGPDAAGKGGKKKGSAPKLTRPVICICNDMYAPALRELRALAQVVQLKKPAVEKLVDRLATICRAEGLMANRDALYALASHSDCDVRSCLHTLQFLSQRMASDASRISPDVVASASLGQKDSKAGLFDAWAMAFLSPTAARRLPRVARAMASAGAAGASRLPGAQPTPAVSGKRWEEAYSRLLFDSFRALASESRLLLAGLHENYTRTRCHDPGLHRTVDASSWLLFGDAINSHAARRSDFSARRFLPTVAVGLHATVSSHNRLRTAFPRADAEARRLKEQRSNILATFCQGRAVGIKGLPGTGSSDRRATVLDVVSPFLTIVNPPLRPVTASLLTPKEKADARDAVAALLACRCTYAQSRVAGAAAESGGPGGDSPAMRQRWQLTPEVHFLCAFGEEGPFHPLHRLPLPDPMRQLLAHEVRLALLRAGHEAAPEHEPTTTQAREAAAEVAMPDHVKRIIAKGRAAAMGGAGASGDATTAPLSMSQVAPEAPVLGSQAGKTPSKSQTERLAAPFTSPSANAVRISSWLAGGALAEGPAADEVKAAKAAAGRKRRLQKSGIYYQHQEGFTNAVRRLVRLEDLL